MNDENMMDDEIPQTDRSESAFFGTSNEAGRTAEDIGIEIVDHNLALLTRQLEHPLRATKYMRTFALLIPQRIIPEHVRDDVIEVVVARAADAHVEYALYTTHLPGYRHAYLDLFQLSASYGELFFVRRVRLYELGNLATDYNASKPMGLENSTLYLNGRPHMTMGGHTVDLQSWRLRTYQGQVVLDTELGEAGQVKIAKSISGFKLRLKDHSPVIGITKTTAGIELAYQRTGHDPRPHRRLVVVLPGNHSGQSPMVDLGTSTSFRIRSTVVGRITRYILEVDAETVAMVAGTLESARDIHEFRKLKGDIAEEMVKLLTRSIGIIIEKDHPYNYDPSRSGSERTGTDLVVSLLAVGELCYVEIKWWDNVEYALKRARKQVLGDVGKHPTWDGKKVIGGIVVVVDWDLRRGSCSLLVEKQAHD